MITRVTYNGYSYDHKTGETCAEAHIVFPFQMLLPDINPCERFKNLSEDDKTTEINNIKFQIGNAIYNQCVKTFLEQEKYNVLMYIGEDGKASNLKRLV